MANTRNIDVPNTNNRHYSIARVLNWTEHYTPTDLINAFDGIYVSTSIDADTFIDFLHINRVSIYNKFTYIILDFALTLDTINDIIDNVGQREYEWIIRVTSAEYNSSYNRENVTQMIEISTLMGAVSYAGKNYVSWNPGSDAGQISSITRFANGADDSGIPSDNAVPPWNAVRLMTERTGIFRGLKECAFDSAANSG